MKRIITNFILILYIYPIIGCKKIEIDSPILDSNSYINDFELLQENSQNHNSIRIRSPKAIIYPENNDIEIFDSTIYILSEVGQDVEIKSGKSNLNNSTKLINVYNNVLISLLNSNNYFIKTNSFNWNLNNSNIDLNSPLNINFDETRIKSSNGSYDIESSLLKINNNIFNRSIFNIDGEEQYNVEIISDKATWFNHNNSIKFTSDDKQVETTINILTIK